MKTIMQSLILAGLVVTLASPALADRIAVAIGAPPAPIAEAIPAPPGPEYVWHPGHWRWIDESNVWVPGHYVRRPYPGAVWVAPRWEQGPRGYVFVEGHWRP